MTTTVTKKKRVRVMSSMSISPNHAWKTRRAVYPILRRHLIRHDQKYSVRLVRRRCDDQDEPG